MIKTFRMQKLWGPEDEKKIQERDDVALTVVIHMIIQKVDREILKLSNFFGILAHYNDLLWRHCHELEQLA